MGYGTKSVNKEVARAILRLGYHATEWSHGGIYGNGSEISYEITDEKTPRIIQSGKNRSFCVWERI